MGAGTRRRTRGVSLAVCVLAGAVALIPARAQGEAVRIAIRVRPIAARAAAIRATVTVVADPGALDGAGRLRLRVRYAAECASTFAGTRGPVAIDRRLPAPSRGRAYAATRRGRARVHALGTYSVCAFVQEQGDQRLYSADFETQFRVTRRCTRATKKLKRLERDLRRAGKSAPSIELRVRRAMKARRHDCR